MICGVRLTEHRRDESVDRNVNPTLRIVLPTVLSPGLRPFSKPADLELALVTV